MRGHENTSQRYRTTSALRGTRLDQDTRQQKSAKTSTTRILSYTDAAYDTMVTMAIVLGDLARVQQTAATAKLAVDAWQLAVGVHDLAEAFASWEAAEVQP
jgi:hypothetical protein